MDVGTRRWRGDCYHGNGTQQGRGGWRKRGIIKLKVLGNRVTRAGAGVANASAKRMLGEHSYGFNSLSQGHCKED